ncbi:hypothetical protein D9M69_667800 [compost metagenome]
MPVSMSMERRCSSLAARVTWSVCSTQLRLDSRYRISATKATAPTSPPSSGSLRLRLSRRSNSTGSIAEGVFMNAFVSKTCQVLPKKII